MPTRPPPLKQRPKPKPWQHAKPSPRLRGRAGVEDRKRILADEPLCRECTKAGRVTVATIVDHIIPLSEGGSDDRGNKQPLCEPCHDAKSKAERARARRRG